jgi:hypothetical protein
MKFRPFGHHDLSEPFPRFLPRSLVSIATYLTIFILGLQFAYYLTFTYNGFFDDEGTMMMLVDSFIKSGGNFDVVGEYHGPFYYLVKYFIHYLTNTDVSPNTNRLTTIGFWSLAPIVCAFFVHRCTNSLILAAIVQLQLIFLLVMLISSAGHPQELALSLIATALLLSSFVGSRRSALLPVVGMAGIVGALLLIKINIGVYLGAALALSMLLFLPPRKLTMAIFALAAFAAVLLPVAVIGNLIFENALDRNYCAQVTLVIAACLVASRKHWTGAELRWVDIWSAALTVLCTVLLICAVVIALGGSLGGIFDTVLLRALRFSMSEKDHVPVKYADVSVALASVLLAVGYRILAPKMETSGRWLLALSALKLSYGVVALCSVYSLARVDFPFQTISFIWIILIPPHSPHPLKDSFPRVFLCFAAAFQAMLAFPVAGAQLYWSIFLLSPLAAVCIGDALSFLWMAFDRRESRAGSRVPPTLRLAIQLAVISCIVAWYWHKMGIGHLRANYASLPSLGLDGADRIHLPKKIRNEILAVVGDLKEHCDGFVGIPGMPSLYFLTGIQPPGVVTDHWAFNMEVDRQKQIIDTMESYQNPCVVYFPEKLNFWTNPQNPTELTRDTRRDITDMPLMTYINDQYTVVREIGDYQFLQKK